MQYSTSHLYQVYLTQLTLNLKSETRKTYLSYIWWVLEPAMFVAVFYLVFAVFLNRGSDNFLVFLLCGKIPFLWFSKTVTNASNAISDGRGLIHQIPIPKMYFPLLVIGQDFVKQCFVFVFLLFVLWAFSVEPSINWLGIIPVILTQLLLVIACSLLAAAVTPFLPDFRFVISTGMMMLMFCSGIFYSYKDVILEKHLELFLLNPLATLIKIYREVLLDSIPVDWGALMQISACSLLVIVFMKLWFSKNESNYARVIIQ